MKYLKKIALISMFIMVIVQLIVPTYAQSIHSSSLMNQQHKTSKYSQTSNQFDFEDLKIGDFIGGLKVNSIEPVDATTPISKDNFKVNFKGEFKVYGKYQHADDVGEYIPNNICMSDFDFHSENKFPKMAGDTSLAKFCFSNIDEAKKQFKPAGSSGKAIVIIKNFTYIKQANNFFSTAELIFVQDKDFS